MADIKTTTVRNSPSVAPSRVPTEMRTDPRPPIQVQPAVDERLLRPADTDKANPAAELISDFVAAPPRTMAWLRDARLTATLQAASNNLAPEGVSEDPTDRYAASVIETHLVARRRLSKLTNSLLKT